jgi:hypothetical protein
MTNEKMILGSFDKSVSNFLSVEKADKALQNNKRNGNVSNGYYTASCNFWTLSLKLKNDVNISEKVC